ncbi:MAG: HD domain-containing protein [Chloroflexota bacterium]|nr:HD domain-containing protein [Chloroflexota bacterium]
MSQLSTDRFSPVARFSLALGAVLAATAIALSAGTAYLLSRYVVDETSSFTQEAVASHFGTVFSDDVFQRGLTEAEEAELTQFVTFHFSIYNVVATQFFDRNGKIVFSYDDSEIGRQIDPTTVPGLAEALRGMRSSQRTVVIADPRLAVPGSTIGYGDYATTHQHGAAASDASIPPSMARMRALEAWTPVTQKGQNVGAVVVWRDMDAIDAALMRIQMTTAAIILAAAVLLWLVLRGVYVRSSKRIVAQARALEGALVEREITYDTTLQALASALDVRDSETGGHSDRVLQYMELVIEQVGVDPAAVSMLRRGALLHDIGKIGVPDNILRKPAALSEAEWVTMRKHPEYGARIVAGIPFLADVSKIVRHHHERWDGHGYPDRLAGEDIPVGARIFAVADSFDAMTSDRPYRRAMSIEAACAEVARCRGTQFDPVVADAFGRIPRDRLGRIADDAPHTHPVAVAG